MYKMCLNKIVDKLLRDITLKLAEWTVVQCNFDQ